jgi:phage tail protein X
MKTVRTNQGDWWDLVAFQAYGRRRGDEHQMAYLIEANLTLSGFKELSANLTLNVPDPGPVAREPLVPWT